MVRLLFVTGIHANATTVQPSFVADVAGAYIVGFLVNDGLVDSDPSDVTIIATPCKRK